MTLTLFSRTQGNAYANSSEALVAFLGLHVKVDYVVHGQTNKLFEEIFSPENRYTPSLYDSETGLVLNQQIAVNRYLLSLAKDTKGLLGKNPEDQYEILQWTNRIDSDIVSKLLYAEKQKMGPAAWTAEKVKEFLENADQRAINVLENHLTKNTYLVGETLTLADVEAAGMLMVISFDDAAKAPFFEDVIKYFGSAEWRKAHPAIIRWLRTILASKPYTEMEAKKAAAAKKADKKAKKAEKVEKAPAAEAPAAEEKKWVHPLSLLGKSSIPIDELKRTYSNKETREEALPWFWNTFYNDEEWSIWKVDYKYNDELTLTFMSNNLIGGFFNRLSASTKYIFGAAVVYGENNNNGIRGAFVIRGKDFMPAFDVAPDWESFEFTRLDASKAEDRELVDDLWAWDKPIISSTGEALEIADGKVFK